MKKLAWAFVCLVSLAVFAGCRHKIQNPEPSIEIITDEGFLVNNDNVTLGVEYPYGFRVASNAETQAELSRLYIVSGEDILCDTTISGTEFEFRGSIYFTIQSRELVGSAEIIATVTDVDGKTNQANIKVDISQEDSLPVYDFQWNRHGGQPATGNLEELGLQWKINANKNEVYAIITPLDGASLYRFNENDNVWNSVNTATQKAALFTENLEPISVLREVSCSAPEKDYNIVIGTIYNEETHLIHITKSMAYTFKGTDVTIVGQYK